MAKYGTGDRVAQAQYGDGTVTRVDTYHTTIDFDDHGPRTFASDRVVLASTSSAAPVRKPVRRARAAKVVKPVVASVPVAQ
jgi:hypothetical protein